MEQNSFTTFDVVKKLLKNIFPENRESSIIMADWIGYYSLNNDTEVNDFLHKNSDFAFDKDKQIHNSFVESYCEYVKNLQSTHQPISTEDKNNLNKLNNDISGLQQSLISMKSQANHNIVTNTEIANINTEISHSMHEKTMIEEKISRDVITNAKTLCNNVLSSSGKAISNNENENTMDILNNKFAPKVAAGKSIESLKNIKPKDNDKQYECKDSNKFIYSGDYNSHNKVSADYKLTFTDWIMSVFSKTKINHGSNGKELGCINYEDLVEIDLSRQYFYSSIYKELKLHDNKLNPNYCLVPVKAYIMIKPLIYLDYTIYNDLHLNVSAALNSVIPDIKLQGKMVHDGQIGQFESYRFEKDFNVIAYKVEDYCLMHGLTDSKFYNSDDLL